MRMCGNPLLPLLISQLFCLLKKSPPFSVKKGLMNINYLDNESSTQHVGSYYFGHENKRS